ncbi:hypothetical protein K435DRAFT_199621 [Dendrothele bispora CBS 962.96]|uniref:Uncharacterized protein n=1 Tax=Dendrothele bispora (strain CBS 962.96) TaxID=1314807 RepID=A0A4S8LTR3_DENBC|nr:hypothetical protein K435DRAFT_199621 [Dendrothele bispora CBS 962.96]
MEDRNNDRHRRGVDVSDDATIRMKTRPKANKSSTDYESSLASGSKPKKSVRATSISSPKLPKGKSTSETIHVSDGSSEDELLLSDDRDSELVEEEENGELKKIQKMESVMLKKPDFSEKNYSRFKIPRTKTSGGTDNASSSKTLRKENDTASRSARSLDISSYSYKPGTSSLTPLSPKSANTRPNPKSHEVPSSPGKSDKASKPTRLKVFGRPPNTSRLETFNSRTAKSATATSGSSQSNVKNAKGKATKVKQRQIVDSDDDIEVSEVPKKTVPETFPLSPPRSLDESSSKSRSLKKTPEAFPMSPDTPVVSKNKAMSSKSRSRDSDEEDVGSDRGRKPAAFPMLESPGLDISFSTPKAGLSGSKGKRSSSVSPDGSGSRRKKKRPHDEPIQTLVILFRHGQRSCSYI